MRVEQLYPVPLKALVQELGRFKNAEVVWCQEEPRNMGSWHFIEPYLEWVLNQINAPNKRPRYAGRAASAATATGSDVEASGAAQGLPRRGAELVFSERVISGAGRRGSAVFALQMSRAYDGLLFAKTD